MGAELPAACDPVLSRRMRVEAQGQTKFALAVPPHTTIEEVKGLALTTGRLVFTGDVAEAWQQAKSNIRDVGQAL